MTELFRKQKKNTKGFTLIELIVVIAILAILGTVVGVVMGGQVTNAKKAVSNENAAIYYSDLQSAWAWSLVGTSTYFNTTTKKASQELADYLEDEMDTASEGVIYVFMDGTDALDGVKGVAYMPKGTNYIGIHGICSDGTNELKADTAVETAKQIAAKATFAITIDSSNNFVYTEEIPELDIK